ncbi:MAG: hypothetical protein SOT68_00540, partial [Oscillospiraceae bacterium]|nr:hypothetical protein [Oscillospiraceae bacterium]
NILRRKNSPCYLKNLFVFEIIFSYRQRLLGILLAVFSALKRVRGLIHTGFHELAGCRTVSFGVFVFQTRL